MKTFIIIIIIMIIIIIIIIIIIMIIIIIIIIIIIPTRLYDCQKKHTDMTGEVTCAGYVIRPLKVSPMSWLVVLPLHRTSTLPDTMQP